MPQSFRETVSTFFAINDVIVQFVHGQVFLVLGVAMWLQWRQRSELDLSRALPWLAAMSLFEALATWGNSFIPIQQQLLTAETIESLRLLQLFVQLMCFASLLGFGLKLNQPPLKPKLEWILPIAVIATGTFVILVGRTLGAGPYDALNHSLEAGLRYLVAFPAALLVAYGLRQQAGRLLGPLHIQRIVRALRVAGTAFLVYAVVEGLLVPRSALPPSLLLNEQSLFVASGIPIGIVRAFVGGIILLFFFRAMEVFRLEADSAAQALNQQQALILERERISRDLHDGTIQSIYAAGLMLEGVNGAQAVQALLNKTMSDVRGYIYDLRNASADEDLARGLLDIVTEFRMRTGLETEWRVDGKPGPSLDPERRQHVYQITREALTNVSRHAGAKRVKVTLRYGDPLTVGVVDDGSGAIPGETTLGRGLRNMRERARLLGATLHIDAAPGKGTRIDVNIPQS